MQNNTSKMVVLLGKIRKQMNGAVLDTFRYYGAKYGMNYGVALHSLREMAREVGCDDDLAHFLYRQQVRELKLAACHIADPNRVDVNEFPFWSRGIANAELAEELAFALLSKIYDINSLMGVWSTESNEMIAYAALMAASRNERTTSEVAFVASEKAVKANPDSVYIAQGVVALMCYVASRDKSVRVGIPSLLESMPECRAKSIVSEELEWRMEYL